MVFLVPGTGTSTEEMLSEYLCNEQVNERGQTRQEARLGVFSISHARCVMSRHLKVKSIGRG